MADALENEIWKPIKNYEGIYEVSSHGRIRRLARFTDNGRYLEARMMKLNTDPNGYLRITLKGGGRQLTSAIHAIALQAFDRDRRSGEIARHLDGNKLNNHISNLKWGTQSENVRDCINHGTHSSFSARHLTDKKAQKALDLRVEGNTYKVIAKKLGVSTHVIGDLLSGKSFGGRYKYANSSNRK